MFKRNLNITGWTDRTLLLLVLLTIMMMNIVPESVLIVVVAALTIMKLKIRRLNIREQFVLLVKVKRLWPITGHVRCIVGGVSFRLGGVYIMWFYFRMQVR